MISSCGNRNSAHAWQAFLFPLSVALLLAGYVLAAGERGSQPCRTSIDDPDADRSQPRPKDPATCALGNLAKIQIAERNVSGEFVPAWQVCRSNCRD